MEDQLALLRNSPSFHQVFSFLGSTASCSTTILCELVEFTREAFLKILQPLWNFSRPVSRCQDTWNIQSVARRLRGDVGKTTFLRNCHNWPMVVGLAPYHFSISSQRWRLFPFPFIGAYHYFAQQTQRALVGESSNGSIVMKTSTSLTYTIASSRRLCLTAGGRDDGGFFGSSDGLFFHQT